jgi:hypothetical protein
LQGSPAFGFKGSVWNWSSEKSASVTIDYGNGASNRQRFTIEFKPEEKSPPVEVEFEASPDGTMLSEVKAEWATPLKKVIADSARLGVRNVKFATKIIGLAGFERETLDKIEKELKLKLKQTLTLFLRTTGNEYLKIQFFGAVGAKYADDKFKSFGEGGVLFEIPFDLADVLK